MENKENLQSDVPVTEHSEQHLLQSEPQLLLVDYTRSRSHRFIIILVLIVMILCLGIVFYAYNPKNDSNNEKVMDVDNSQTTPVIVDSKLKEVDDIVDVNNINMKKIAVGGSFACGINIESKAYCWGYNYWGQLGDGSTRNSHEAVKVYDDTLLNEKKMVSIAAGMSHACGLTSDGYVYCWGDNDNGQLGNNSVIKSTVPVQIDMTGVLKGKTILSISSGWARTCALASDYKVYCWGYGKNGELGIGSPAANSIVPTAVDASGVLKDKKIIAISGSCAVDSDNLIYCWGINYAGQVGDGTRTDSLSPTAVTANDLLVGQKIVSVTSTNSTTCAIVLSGDAFCWGQNTSGSVISVMDTEGVLNKAKIKDVSSGVINSCFVASDYHVYCTGNNIRGGLGIGSDIAKSSQSLKQVYSEGVLKNIKLTGVATGGYSCAISEDNDFYCWGSDNKNGELGNYETDGFVPSKVEIARLGN